MGSLARVSIGPFALAAASAVLLLPARATARELEYRYSVLFAAGDPAPDGEKLGSGFETWSLNERGQLAFDVELAPSGVVGVFRYDRGRILEIAKTGDVAPGGGGTFFFPTTMSMNRAGDVAFSEVLRPILAPPTGVN